GARWKRSGTTEATAIRSRCPGAAPGKPTTVWSQGSRRAPAGKVRADPEEKDSGAPEAGWPERCGRPRRRPDGPEDGNRSEEGDSPRGEEAAQALGAGGGYRRHRARQSTAVRQGQGPDGCRPPPAREDRKPPAGAAQGKPRDGSAAPPLRTQHHGAKWYRPGSPTLAPKPPGSDARPRAEFLGHHTHNRLLGLRGRDARHASS